MRIAICDDDPASLTHIAFLLESWAKGCPCFSLERFSEGDSLIRAQKSGNPFDIILLDIIMPGFNGIETAREIRAVDKAVKIVFLTSSSEFAVDSYSVKASNYLLKPVSPEALFACLEELSGEIAQAQASNAISVKSPRTVHRLNPSTIEYLEAHGKHVSLTLSNGSVIDSIEPLYLLEGKLSITDGFYKCHRSYIVNINHVSTYSSDEITMRSGARIPISRNCRSEFKDAYFSVIFGEVG